MKSYIVLPQKIKNQIESKIIWLTGCARSGTTIIGNILGSMKGVEYFFEPESLKSIFFIKDKMDIKSWSLLFETYLYRDLINNSLNNRKVNLNEKDDSYIFKIKDKKSFNKKFENKFDLVKLNKKNKFFFTKIIIKLPDVTSEVIQLKKIYPNFKIIFVDRNPLEIINSLVKKKWFTSQISRLHPIIKKGSKFYPYWLDNKQYKLWDKMNIYERSAIYTIKVREIIKKNKKIIVINYNDLVENPSKVIKKIEKKLNLKRTKKTLQLFKSLRRRTENLSWIERQIRPEIFRKLIKI